MSKEYELHATKPEGSSLQEYLVAANIAPGDNSGSGVIQAPATSDPNSDQNSIPEPMKKVGSEEALETNLAQCAEQALDAQL